MLLNKNPHLKENFMETFSLMRQAHPCIPGTLSVGAIGSLCIAIKGITLTLAAASTAHVVMSLVGIYLCVSTILTTKRAWESIKMHANRRPPPPPSRLGLVDDNVGKTIFALVAFILGYPIARTM